MVRVRYQYTTQQYELLEQGLSQQLRLRLDVGVHIRHFFPVLLVQRLEFSKVLPGSFDLVVAEQRDGVVEVREVVVGDLQCLVVGRTRVFEIVHSRPIIN